MEPTMIALVPPQSMLGFCTTRLCRSQGLEDTQHGHRTGTTDSSYAAATTPVGATQGKKKGAGASGGGMNGLP